MNRVVFGVVLGMGCAHEPAALEAHPTTAHAAAHWSYEGAGGPEHWAELDPQFAACGVGTHQSPIDIPASAEPHALDVTFAYAPSPLVEVNNGHTVEVDYAPGSSLVMDGTTYDLAQMHFHAPSEHTLAGRSFPMELHLVHKSAGGELSVVGILLGEGEENPAFREVLSHLPEEPGAQVTDPEIAVDPAVLLPAARTAWRYEGSLTTPPCTEGVHWAVMSTPVMLSTEQIAVFTRLYPHDNRPVQPLHDRQLQ